MKNKLIAILLVGTMLFSQGCATILNGPVTSEQKTKPAAGQPQRQVYAGYLILDILFGVIPVVVDFATGAIYKKQASGGSKVKQDNQDVKAKQELKKEVIEPQTENQNKEKE